MIVVQFHFMLLETDFIYNAIRQCFDSYWVHQMITNLICVACSIGRLYHKPGVHVVMIHRITKRYFFFFWLSLRKFCNVNCCCVDDDLFLWWLYSKWKVKGKHLCCYKVTQAKSYLHIQAVFQFICSLGWLTSVKNDQPNVVVMISIVYHCNHYNITNQITTQKK